MHQSKHKIHSIQFQKLSQNYQSTSHAYIKQIFTNFYLKQTKKEQQNIYCTSIEVLNQLLLEYEEKFNSQISTKNQNIACLHQQANYQLKFEQFYNRLRMLLEGVYQRFLLSESGKKVYNHLFQQSLVEQQMNYASIQSLFPQNQNNQIYHTSRNEQKFYKTLQKSQNCDEDLYQLLLDLKSQLKEKSQKLTTLQKQLKQKSTKLDETQKQLKAQKLSNKTQKQVLSALKTKYSTVEQQKTQLFNQLNDSLDKIQNLCEINQQINKQMLQKNIKIQQLNKQGEQIKQLSIKIIKTEQEMKNKQKEVVERQQQNKKLNNQIAQVLQKNKKLSNDNKRLKLIIQDKLNLITLANKENMKPNQLNQSNDQMNMKQNRCQQQYLKATNSNSNSSSSNYISSLIQQKLQNKTLMNNLMQKQLINFMKNVEKR